MTAFTKTISDTIRVYGPGYTSKFGTAIWDTNLWSEGGNDLTQDVTKYLSESQSLADAFSDIKVNKVISESQALSDNNADIYLTLGNYYHVFRSNTVDADDQSTASYTAGTNPSSTYSQTTNPTTVWS